MKIWNTCGRLHVNIFSISLAGIILMIGSYGCQNERTRHHDPILEPFAPEYISTVADSVRMYAVVEIPAGTSDMMEIDSSGSLRNTGDGPLNFLPFPGNFGFIAGCSRRDTMTGAISKLHVLVIMEALAPKSVVEVKPVATLVLSNNLDQTGDMEETDPVVIAVPVDSSLQTIHVGDFVDFITEFDAARSILQQWFVNYRGRKMFGVAEWRDEHYTRQLIRERKLKE